MHQEITGDSHNQIPRLRRHASRCENPARRKKFGAPTLGREEECVWRESESDLVEFGVVIFHSQSESVPRGNGPRLRKSEHHIAWVVGRRSEGYRGIVPLGAGIGKMEATPAGETKL